MGTACATSSATINWAYQNSLGEDVSVGTQESAIVFKLPFSYSSGHLRDYGRGLKFQFPLTVGIYNIKGTDEDIDLDILALVPGIEYHVQVLDNWVLIPMVNFGLGKETSRGDVQYLYSIGIKHRVFFEWEKADFVFGNTLRDDGNFNTENEQEDDILLFSTGLDIRYPLGFNLFKKTRYISLYGVHYYYFDDVIVIGSEAKSIEIDTQWELGVTLLSVPKWKIWLFTFERVGIGYRFGDRFSAIRLVFGMPF